jgi:hypothetical protein
VESNHARRRLTAARHTLRLDRIETGAACRNRTVLASLEGWGVANTLNAA